MLKSIINKSGYYRIKVIPNQAQHEYRGIMADNTIKIALKAKPERGQANQALREFLSDQLVVDKSQVRLVSGLTSRIKLIEVTFE